MKLIIGFIEGFIKLKPKQMPFIEEKSQTNQCQPLCRLSLSVLIRVYIGTDGDVDRILCPIILISLRPNTFLTEQEVCCENSEIQ